MRYAYVWIDSRGLFRLRYPHQKPYEAYKAVPHHMTERSSIYYPVLAAVPVLFAYMANHSYWLGVDNTTALD